eukprot:2609349-Amphidinium_carterae.1
MLAVPWRRDFKSQLNSLLSLCAVVLGKCSKSKENPDRDHIQCYEWTWNWNETAALDIGHARMLDPMDPTYRHKLAPSTSKL